jgi:hypothetical protein
VSPDRPVPLLGDISLTSVQRVEHALDGGFAPTRIASLPGELQQRSGRPSHRVLLSGLLFGDAAAGDLATLQDAAAAGEELTFAADITTALELQRVVVTHLRAVEDSGIPGLFAYEIGLAESPPLPPPAELEPFGGLGDFGLGDLGFDAPGLLDDLQDLAGEVAAAVDQALEVVGQLGALAGLEGLNLDAGFLEPLGAASTAVGGIAAELSSAARSIGEAFGS